jgi:hypothetical protein
MRVLSLGVEQQGGESDHYLQPVLRSRKSGSVHPLSPTTSWHSAGMSNFKQVVIYFLVSKLTMIYHLLPNLALSKNIDKNSTTHDKFVVKATYIEITDLLFSLATCLGLHSIHHLWEVR